MFLISWENVPYRFTVVGMTLRLVQLELILRVCQ